MRTIFKVLPYLVKPVKGLRLLIATVGFDEKLPMRALLSLGVNSGDRLVLVYVKPLGDYERMRVEGAVRAIRETLKGVGVEIYEVAVTGSNLSEDLSILSREIRGLVEEREVIAIPVGGMRILIPLVVTVLSALNAYLEVPVKFMFIREDGLYKFTITPEYFNIPRSSRRELEVLSIIKELEPVKRARLIDTVRARLGVTQALAYRWLDNLKRKGLVSVEGSRVSLTPLGRATAILVKG